MKVTYVNGDLTYNSYPLIYDAIKDLYMKGKLFKDDCPVCEQKKSSYTATNDDED